jgi:hypothetical protein
VLRRSVFIPSTTLAAVGATASLDRDRDVLLAAILLPTTVTAPFLDHMLQLGWQWNAISHCRYS